MECRNPFLAFQSRFKTAPLLGGLFCFLGLVVSGFCQESAAPSAASDMPSVSIAQAHVLHVKLDAEILQVKQQLSSLSVKSLQNQKALGAAQERALQDEALAEMSNALDPLRAELETLLNAAPGVAPLIEKRDLLKIELETQRRTRMDAMLQMQKEGINDELRESLTASAQKASEAKAELARLARQIDALRSAVRESDAQTKSLSAKVIEHEQALQASVGKDPEVAALEVERTSLQTQTRDLTVRRAELQSQLLNLPCCRTSKISNTINAE